jgi:hypothetical protein
MYRLDLIAAPGRRSADAKLKRSSEARTKLVLRCFLKGLMCEDHPLGRDFLIAIFKLTSDIEPILLLDQSTCTL